MGLVAGLVGFGMGCAIFLAVGRQPLAVMRPSVDMAMQAMQLPGPSPWKELAIAAIEGNNRCEVGGIKPTPRFAAALSKVSTSDIKKLRSTVVAMAKKQSAPTGKKV